MKKIFALSIVASAFAFSCSKNHTCVCTESYNGTGTPWETTTEYAIENSSKDDARIACQAGNSEQTLLGTETYTKSCGLK